MKHPLTTILIDLLRKCVCCAGAVTELFFGRQGGWWGATNNLHPLPSRDGDKLNLSVAILTYKIGFETHVWNLGAHLGNKDI